MEQVIDRPELQAMSPAKKAQFIEGRLSRIPPNDHSATWWDLSSVRLLHPQLLWPNFWPISDHGIMIRLTAELDYRGKKERGLLVELATHNGPGKAIFSAIFGLGAVGVTMGGDLIIDCTQVERPGAGAQMTLQNTFMKKGLT